MGMLFSVRGTLSPLVERRWVPVHAETDLFKCQCEAPLPHPRSTPVADTEMSLGTRSNQFRICMLCLDSGSNRFIVSMSRIIFRTGKLFIALHAVYLLVRILYGYTAVELR